MMIVADEKTTLTLTGAGDVIEPQSGIAAIGSGGEYARAAARALFEETKLDAETIVRKAMAIFDPIDTMLPKVAFADPAQFPKFSR